LAEAEAEQAAMHLAKNVGGVRGEVIDAQRQGALATLRLPDEDSAVMHEAVRRGGAIVHATVPDDKHDTIVSMLERDGCVNVDDRIAAWRKDTGVGGTQGTSEQGSIPIVEERLRVSKRQGQQGHVRVRSYVVETPVQEEVTLRQEHVQVERRPVDRPLTAEDAAFQERTIEATETREEPVISKEARVTGEVSVKKTAEEQKQTVRDTVRRTEVEVDDERASANQNEKARRRPAS
jgi:uncharacterized protein (TIGR02271 family)